MYDPHVFFTRTQEPYSLLLQRREWDVKRMRILTRDNRTCQKCGRSEKDGVTLQVHHLHYISGLDPWEYKDSELITYCEQCHAAVHQNNHVPVYRLVGGNLVEIKYTPCYRCNGSGYLPEYRHVLNGICFRCHGERFEEYIKVVESYAREHDINLAYIDDGFKPLAPKLEKVGKVVKAQVLKSKYKDGVYIELIFESGRIARGCLDFSVAAKPGDTLDPDTLRYKKKILRNGEPCVIIKGTLC